MTLIQPGCFPVSRIGRATLLAMAGLTLGTGAMAAPFCLRDQAIPPQCIYFDAASCQKEAARHGSVCSVNPKEVRLVGGVGQYCVVTSEKVSLCIFPDRESCTAEATRKHGVCADAPRVAPAKAPDPYSPINGQ